MSANIKKKIPDPTNSLTRNDPEREMIDMTNRFYLDMTKNILSDKEYDIIKKILIGKYTLQSIAAEYGLTKQGITYIYRKAFFKVKSVSELVKEINALKEKKNQLYKTYLFEYKELTKGRKKIQFLILTRKFPKAVFHSANDCGTYLVY